METKLRHYKALIVSSQPKFNEETKLLLTNRQRIEMELEGSVSSARRRLNEREFDIVIINSPLPDENGIRLAIDKSTSGNMAVLLMIPEKFYGEIFERVCQSGVFTISKPISRQRMEQALDWLESACERIKKVKQNKRQKCKNAKPDHGIPMYVFLFFIIIKFVGSSRKYQHNPADAADPRRHSRRILCQSI